MHDPGFGVGVRGHEVDVLAQQVEEGAVPHVHPEGGQRDFDAAFANVDVLATPSAPTTAFPLGSKIDDPLAMYLNDLTTIPANLAGIPGISLPSGLAEEDGLPVGIQFMAPAREDARLYTVGAALEQLLEAQWGGPLLAKAPQLG